MDVGGITSVANMGMVKPILVDNAPPLTENPSNKMMRQAVSEAVKAERSKTDQKSTDQRGQAKEFGALKSEMDVTKVVERLNTKTNNQLSFSVDKELNQTVVKVIDKETKEVLKQFPSEEAMKLSKTLGKYNGSLVKEFA